MSFFAEKDLKIVRHAIVHFQILAMFTILDNLVDGLCGWADTFRDHRFCVNFCAAFALIAVGVGAGILHTTQVNKQ